MDAEVRRQMVLAREYYQHHEYERAEPLLRAVIAQHPGSAEMFNMLGVIQHHHGLFIEAQQMFEQALHLNPGYTEAALSLAVVYNDTGRYEDAQRIFARAVAPTRGQPRHLDRFARGKLANLHAMTAQAYRELGLYDEAIDEYRKALVLGPQFPDLHCELALTHAEKGDRESAEAACRTVLAQVPHYAPAWVLLGAELYAQQRLDEAREAWQKALAADPHNPRVAVYLTWVTPPPPSEATVQ